MLRIRLVGKVQTSKLRDTGIICAACLVLGGMLAGWRMLIVTACLAALLLLFTNYFNRRLNREAWYFTIAPGTVTLSANSFQTKQINFSDIDNISVRQPSLASKAAVIINSQGSTLAVGLGHPLESLNWLSNVLIMELAGLTWKPLHGVDRNRSRNRTSVADNAALLKSDLATRLIAIYQALAPDVLNDLKAAIEKKDAPFVRQNAHWLKSASANVGAHQLSELFQRMQIYGTENNLERAHILLQEIEKKSSEVSRWLDLVRTTQITNIALKFQGTQVDDDASADTATTYGTARHKAKILVVDDSAVSREIAAEFLGGLVSEVSFAHNAEQALERCQLDTFELILMDCEMAGVDGYECTRRIRQRERALGGARTIIIALTAHALKGDRAKCLAAGMDDYLSKPYAPEELIEKVDEWLRDAQQLRANQTGALEPEQRPTLAATS